jgi:hypothetical protein
MRVKLFALVPAAALVLTGAALAAMGQSGAPRKATPRPTPTPAVEQRQPQKVSTRPEDGKGTDEVPASVRAGIPAKPKEDPNAARYVYEFRQPDFLVYFIHIEHDDSGRGARPSSTTARTRTRRGSRGSTAARPSRHSSSSRSGWRWRASR